MLSCLDPVLHMHTTYNDISVSTSYCCRMSCHDLANLNLAECRFSSPSLEGGVPLARASPKARASDLGAGATARSRLARGQSSGYAVRRGASELPPS